MPPRHVTEDALVDDAPGGATAASIAELEKRLTAQAIALEKRLAEQFEAATAALLARLAPPVQSPPPKGTQPAIPAGAPAPEGGEQGAQEPLLAELDALDTELEYVDFAYFGQVPPSGLEPPPRDGDEPRLWILTGDTELEKRLTAQAIALEKRLAEQFEAPTAALLARLAPPVQSPPPKGTQPAIPAGAPAPEGGEQGAQEPLPAELDALDTELEYVDFAYFGQVPPSGLEPPPRDGDEPRLWILTDDTAARGLAEQQGLTAYDKYLYLGLELSLFRYEERLGKQRDYDLKSKLMEEPVRSAKTASHVETIEALKALAINRDFPTDMRSLSHRMLDTPVYAVSYSRAGLWLTM
eukprot:jgi/Tetstr1/440486/TSEL_028812.t1